MWSRKFMVQGGNSVRLQMLPVFDSPLIAFFVNYKQIDTTNQIPGPPRYDLGRLHEKKTTILLLLGNNVST